jgi:hypothetical protein
MSPVRKTLFVKLLLIILGGLLIGALYLLLLKALPKYAARVPYIALLFAVDLLTYRYLSPLWRNYRNWIRASIAVIWWLPLGILLFFLFGSVFIPMPEMAKFLRIYLPGFALVFFLSKSILLVSLIPSFILLLIQKISAGFKRRRSYSVEIKFLKQMGLFFGSLALAGLLVGSTVWVYRFKTHRIELSIQNLPAAFEGLRIVQLSDIHLGSWLSSKPLQKAVDQVNALNPDIIVFTGDLVNYSTSEVRGFEQVLAQLKAPMGIYTILGNHDYGDYISWKKPEEKEANLQQLVDFYDSLSWKLLRNESFRIEKDGASLLIAGVENWSATTRFKKYGDLYKTMENTPYADVNVLLSHDPTHWETEVSKDFTEFDITLSGHTHGMQMGIEAFGWKWSPARYLYDNWAGLASVDVPGNRRSYLYVNRGLGHIAYPGRVGILPEITLLTLKKAE